MDLKDLQEQTYKRGFDDGWRAAVESRKQPMSRADVIRSMTDEELADYLKRIGYGRETPWSAPFEKKFCDCCQPVRATIAETGIEHEFAPCEFDDAKCPHGDDVLWWLREPAGS